MTGVKKAVPSSRSRAKKTAIIRAMDWTSDGRRDAAVAATISQFTQSNVPKIIHKCTCCYALLPWKALLQSTRGGKRSVRYMQKGWAQ